MKNKKNTKRYLNPIKKQTSILQPPFSHPQPPKRLRHFLAPTSSRFLFSLISFLYLIFPLSFSNPSFTPRFDLSFFFLFVLHTNCHSKRSFFLLCSFNFSLNIYLQNCIFFKKTLENYTTNFGFRNLHEF